MNSNSPQGRFNPPQSPSNSNRPPFRGGNGGQSPRPTPKLSEGDRLIRDLVGGTVWIRFTNGDEVKVFLVGFDRFNIIVRGAKEDSGLPFLIPKHALAVLGQVPLTVLKSKFN